MNKEGINFQFAGHVVSCDKDEKRLCTRRLYGPKTPEDVEIIDPYKQTDLPVGICSIVSNDEERYVCRYQIEGITVFPKK